MPLSLRALTLALSLPLAGCSGWSSPIDSLRPYKIDIQQGNAITQEMLGKLKPGMTPSQVRFILGTPLVTDPFHPERWDYVYRHSQAGKQVEQRRVTVVFAEEKLLRIEGDVVAAGGAAEAKVEEARAGAGAPPAEGGAK